MNATPNILHGIYSLPIYGYVSNEIWSLAWHHKGIIKHTLPDYYYNLYETHEGEAIIRVETMRNHAVLLVATFYPSSLKIVVCPPLVPAWKVYETIDYANPKFTDSIIADKLRELEDAKARR